MSKLAELLDELCPDGVEYRPLGELCSKTSRFKWENLLENAQYVDLTSVDIPTRRISATTEVDESTAPSRARQEIRVGDVLFGTTRPTQMRICIVPEAYDKQVASTGYCVLRAEQDVVLPSWLFYALQTGGFAAFLENNQSTGSYPAISDKKLKQYQIPVPPLEVQQEIVRVLDAFTDLEQSLVSELALRKKQFEEYRNTVIDDLNSKGFEYKQLSEVIDLKPGVRITKRNDSGSLYPVYGGGGESFRTDDFNRKDDFVISRFAMSENCVRYIPGDFWLLDSGISFDVGDRVEKRFVGHNLLRMQPEIFRCSSKSAQRNLKIRALLALEIPVPPLDEQQQIVTKLDAFESLINSIEKEIVLRRRQYEYYRDELLSFNPSTSRGA